VRGSRRERWCGWWKEKEVEGERVGLERMRSWKKREFKDFWGSIEGWI